ncbi:MAG: MotA/TolQ/ExbB proton channel family protein [Planctomycetota bacterium]
MFWRFMEIGGPIMWALMACSVALLAVLVERAWTIGVRGQLLRVQIGGAARFAHRKSLAVFTDLPLSIGLLGTVVGVVQSFQLVEGRLDSAAVGAGLGTACLTTVYGLSIGIVASAARYVLEWAAGPEPLEKGVR